MSKKKKIIISVTAAVLVLAMILTCVAVVIGNKKDREREREEYEQAQNADTNNSTSTTSPETDIPPVIQPDDTGDDTTKDDIILDVTDEDRDPNPGVVDATIEYDTKEGAEDAE